MAWSSLSSRLDGLPLLLTGPILRRAEKTGVSVWFVLKENRAVTLSVYASDTATDIVFSAVAEKGIALGDHVYAYCITAVQTASNPTALATGSNYYYDIDFGNGQLLTSFNDALTDGKRFTYGNEQRPGFSLPPDDINSVRLVHGSCRKAHGEGDDALEAVNKMLATSVAANNLLDPLKRPHQLYFTGDQIYADDVADLLFFMVDDAGKVLFNWDEDDYGTGNDPTLYFTADELKPGKRNLNNKLYTATGFTSMIADTPECSKSHLLKFRDYAAMYLFAWSDVLWPKISDLPDFAAVLPNDKPDRMVQIMDTTDTEHQFSAPTKEGLQFNDELAQLIRFKSKLCKIRRALANVPVYMILDDHDVTDDWNLNWAWCKQVYAKPLGRRTVQNGLLAYTIFQAWGNTPDQFAAGHGMELLQNINDWRGVAGDLTSNMEKLLNIPTLTKDSAPADFVHQPDTINWHYSYEAAAYTIIFLDSRTWRHYPAPDPIAFAGLICKEGFNNQIPAVLPDKQIILLVAPCPVIDVPFIEQQQKKKSDLDGLLDSDCESWPLDEYSYEKLFSMLASRLPVSGSGDAATRKGVFAILSGDVHFGFSARAQLWGKHFLDDTNDGIDTNAVFAQLVSSAFKNYLSKKCCHGNNCSQRAISEWKNTEELHINGYPQTIAEPLDNLPFIGDLLANVLPLPQKRFGFRVSNDADRLIGERTGSVVSNTYPFRIESNPAIALTYDELQRQQVSKLYRTDWQFYIDWLLAEKTVNTTITPTGVHTEPVDAASGLADYLALAKDHGSHYVDEWGDGKEIVGLNNAGEIKFQFATAKQVSHSLWWRLNPISGDAPDAFPLSVFQVPLNYQGDKDSNGDEIKMPAFP